VNTLLVSTPATCPYKQYVVISNMSLWNGGSMLFRSFTDYQTMRRHNQGDSKLSIRSFENLKFLHSHKCCISLTKSMKSVIKYYRQTYVSGFQTLVLTGQHLLRHAERLIWQHCGKEETPACGMRTIITFRIIYLRLHYVCVSKINFKFSYKYSFICYNVS